jgi:hypothetical protein
MQFIYPLRSRITTTELLLWFYEQPQVDPQYASILKELESRTVEMALQLAVQRRLVALVEPTSDYSPESVLRILNRDLQNKVFMIVPLDALAALYAIIEASYLHNQYVKETIATMEEFGACAVSFASNDGTRIRLDPIPEDDEEMQLIRDLIQSVTSIDIKFDRDECESNLVQLIRFDASDSVAPSDEDIYRLVGNEWLLTLNEAANTIAANLLNTLRAL